MKRTATHRHAGRRVDVWLHAELPHLSRTRIQALLAAGHITIADRPVKPNTLVTDGMVAAIDIPRPAPTELVAEAIPLDILHEDADLVVVNKPAGLVVHPAAGHSAGTLVNALLFHCKDLAGIGGELRPGIVHRLDKDTTGVLVAAKNDRAMDRLIAQFKRGEVHKKYIAIVYGVPVPARGVIDTLIGRAPHDRKKMSARPRSGRRAVTRYEVVESGAGCSRLAIEIDTGRTHQIRVHMAHIGHPVLGDRQYASGRKRRSDHLAAARQLLHARQLSFLHPATGCRVTFRAPLPADMREAIRRLREVG